MLDNSFDGLCRRMQGKSITRGWDAVVTMNRTKVNALFEQQYIDRINKYSFIERITGSHPIDTSGYAVLELSGLILSQPLLSFENASLANSRARLTFRVEAGTVNQRLKLPGAPERVTSSFVVSPQQGFEVHADIDLRKTTGLVEKQGRVFIDLGDAVNFTSNLVADDLPQIALGKFFHELYSSYPPEIRVYELGMLDFDDDDMLVPREFEVRTQKAPGADDVLSDSYGDGAVVLFIRTRNNPTNGSLPVDDGDFAYHIPDDRDPNTGERIYSGSLVLASRVVFDWYVEPFMMKDVGHNLRLQRHNPSIDNARTLRAVAGGFFIEDFDISWANNAITDDNIKNLLPMSIFFANDNVDQALRVFSKDNALGYDWWVDVPYEFRVCTWLGLIRHCDNIKTFVRVFVHVEMLPQVDALTNIVQFEMQPDSARLLIDTIDRELAPYIPGFVERRISNLLNPARAAIRDSFKGFSAPPINVFHLNHLLFPQQNALLLTQAALPGDLFLAGHIDPKLTSFTLEPLFGRVKVGATLKFEIKQLALRAQAVTWSVRGIDGSRSTGTIGADGTFVAPDAGLMEGVAVRNVVTASYRDSESGELRQASALVVVVVEPMTITPTMLTIDVRDASPVTLRASVLRDEALRWTLIGPGTLTPSGHSAVYTAPASISEQLLPVEIEVIGQETGDRVVASVLLLNGIFALPVKPGFHPGLPTMASMQLRVDRPGVQPGQVKWRLIAGGGSVDERTGEYTAPEQIRSPYALVQASIGNPPLEHKGYSLIHLSDYARAPRWKALSSFTLTTDSLSTRVLANGMQQVNVVVEVKPESDADGNPVDISDEEWESIRLVTKDWAPLKQVGAQGVPARPEDEGIAWDPWGGSNTRNEYRQYQGAADAPALVEDVTARNGRTRTFYVQTRAQTKLEIAAYLRGDNGLPYYSNESGGSVADKRLIEITPIAPPNFTSSLYTITPTRVEGGQHNDDDMTTIDYYTLRLEMRDSLIRVKSAEFLSARSIVQWESRQYAEDACSFVGYAVYGSNVLNFDPLLYARMPDPGPPAPGEPDKRVRPAKTLKAGHQVPEGHLLCSLHRCEYWNFDIGCEPDYTSGLRLRLYDIDGNRHALKIRFNSVSDRNSLVAERDV